MARTPTNPVLAALEMEGGGAEGEPGDPLAVELGDVAEGLAGQAGIGQIMLSFQRTVEDFAFVVADEAEGDSFQNGGFADRVRHRHTRVVRRGAARVQSFRTKVPPAFELPIQLK